MLVCYYCNSDLCSDWIFKNDNELSLIQIEKKNSHKWLTPGTCIKYNI